MHRMSRVPYRVIARDWWLRLSYPLLAMTLRLRHILANDKMHMTRLMIGASSLTWASILLGPSQVFNDNIVIYLVMRVLMSENVWGLLFLISGLVSIYSVLMDVRNRVTIYLDALLGAFLWSASTVCCFVAFWPIGVSGFWNQLAAYQAPAAMSGELWLSAAAWWHLIRHVTDYPHRAQRTRKEDFLP